ncbi:MULTISPECIES: AMP-binding protein [Shewanella]|uniref:AMP-binding protein n=1 Tax=Shewanella vesiculosa TaxID=518738 RepID=A0ABV0FUG6_9GAMM|nr:MULTISPECIES: AMP-binding protein [Shewanella]NCQ44798.1 AMP-binding protein [Shewanella frigidimarina]MBB1322362.1 AMP-binding protein [Shewanella sp. SR43-8]NCO71927.1 AMP-binding protein [Shewanella vesiculosa]NCP37351.1 AMP-binding protein [Shewanella vesiculosa]NCP70553.1 AMP-binding protein [Shewanella vesiculosa]
MENLIKTPVEMLSHWVDTQGDKVYLRQPIDGKYVDFTWREVQQKVQQIAGSLRHLGLERGDKVAVLSKNCAEWFIVDLALMYGGYISVPVYPTANAETIRYILEHSGAKAIFTGKLDHWAEQEAAVGGEILRLAMPYDTMPAQYHWEQLLKLGQPLVDEQLPTADQVMTLIYTSGSTGKPKGAIQTFTSYGWACEAVIRDLQANTTDRLLSYLPLAHITERVAIEGSSFYSGATVSFVEGLDSFVDDIQRCRPTIFFSVPRLWTVFQLNIINKIGEKKLKTLLKLPIISSIVKRKIKKGLGLDQSRLNGSGSAPIPPSLLQWYNDIGIDICEAWGMTENCAYSIINHPFNAKKIGTVGRPVEGCLVRQTEQGELLVKSPGLMSGYYLQDEATAAAFTEDGFFHTGDLCEIDADGYIDITGRVKDNFKTSKGKYVAPVPIERKLAQDSHIELICVIGSGLPHPVALVQLSEGSKLQPREEVRTSLKETLDSINPHLESHEHVDAIIIVNDDWTIENDVLTPTLKIKRHVLEKTFSAKVDGVRGAKVRWEDEL